DVLGVVAHRVEDLAEDELQELIGRDIGRNAKELVRLEGFMQRVQGGDNLIAHGNYEIFASNDVYFLLVRALLILVVGREVEYEERDVLLARSGGHGRRERELVLDAL